MAEFNVEGIKLGQAEKQASDYLKGQFIFKEDYGTVYKQTVRNFYKWNSELETELLCKKEEPVKNQSSNGSSLPRDKPIPQAQPSPKQQLCPKCGKAIPKTFFNHYECGWNVGSDEE